MSKKLPSQTYHDISFDVVRNKLKLKSIQERVKFEGKFPHIKDFLNKRNLDLGKIRQHSAKLLGAGAIAGALFLAPTIATALPSPSPTQSVEIAVKTPQDIVVNDVKSILPDVVRPLSQVEEKQLGQIFNNVIGVPATATLEGEHLNTTYGLIGAEQHLRRYPGDTLNQQGTFGPYDEGMAPGLGAWGYFAPSATKLTPQLSEDEKWYVAVQTLYLSDWTKRLAYLRDWYKYRKVLVVNTLNGNAVVADVADSGPAAWTGKSFGGSPEVMDALGGPKYKVGPVVLFFVDDPNNKIPLGPVGYNKITANLADVSLYQAQ